MRIHSNTLTAGDLQIALFEISPHLYLECHRHGSRSHDHAFEAQLEWAGEKVKGDRRYRRNSGVGAFGTGWAATYDEWGEWLDSLYAIDPAMKAGPYKNREDFLGQTQRMKDAGYRARFNWLERG